MKKHLLKKVALVALTVTSVAATSGVVDAGNYSSGPRSSTGYSSPYDDGGFAARTPASVLGFVGDEPLRHHRCCGGVLGRLDVAIGDISCSRHRFV